MLVKNGDVRLKRSKTRKSPPTKAMVRLTVSLPKAVLARVNIIAGQMKVSAGWVLPKAPIEFVDLGISLFCFEGKIFLPPLFCLGFRLFISNLPQLFSY